ncbi:VTT domain-containing protein [Candidatus Gottesmanbacteria bacterium]|nr:VTT domain-containing protein [Candidatus Gottesmanbacteria bacterium]
MNFDLTELIKTIGLLGVFGIVFAESGLLIGFFLPGDSLLFTAGFLASQGFINIWILAIGSFIAAVVGDSVGYSLGHRLGKRLFQRENSLLFHKDNLLKAKAFYEKHGGKTIILARFMPIIRTFAPIVAGMGDMHYQTFLSFNLIGGLFWAVGISVAGYTLGNVIPDVDKYLLPIVVIIILLSVLPSAIHILKERQHRKQLLLLLKRAISGLGISV